MQVENRIPGQPGCLVGFIADKILAADEQSIATDLEGVGDRIIDAKFDPVTRDRRNSVARHDLDIAVGIGERAVGADLQSIKEARIHERIAGIELQRLRRQIHLSLDALALCPTHVLEVAKSLQLGTGNRQDVIGIGRPERADFPPDRSDIQLPGAAQTGLTPPIRPSLDAFEEWLDSGVWAREPAGVAS